MKWIKALDRKKLDKRDYQFIKVGDKIKLYGEETIVKGFYFSYNEGTEKWETIILTTQRGDPLERSLSDIEVCEDSCQSPLSVPLVEEKKEEGVNQRDENIYDSAWPLNEVLEKLISASEYLLHKKDYDGPDYEEIEICVKRAKQILSSPPADQQGEKREEVIGLIVGVIKRLGELHVPHIKPYNLGEQGEISSLLTTLSQLAPRLASTPHSQDMTVQEFYSGFNLDFMGEEEKQTIYTATELFAMGKVRMAHSQQYQLCPKCNGDGNLLRYNSPNVYSETPICDVCNGAKVLLSQPGHEVMAFANWLGKEDLKLYAEGWCQPGGSNGLHLSTEELYKLFISSQK